MLLLATSKQTKKVEKEGRKKKQRKKKEGEEEKRTVRAMSLTSLPCPGQMVSPNGFNKMFKEVSWSVV